MLTVSAVPVSTCSVPSPVLSTRGVSLQENVNVCHYLMINHEDLMI